MLASFDDGRGLLSIIDFLDLGLIVELFASLKFLLTLPPFEFSFQTLFRFF